LDNFSWSKTGANIFYQNYITNRWKCHNLFKTSTKSIPFGSITSFGSSKHRRLPISSTSLGIEWLQRETLWNLQTAARKWYRQSCIGKNQRKLDQEYLLEDLTMKTKEKSNLFVCFVIKKISCSFINAHEHIIT
jgi:hypothetical protein